MQAKVERSMVHYVGGPMDGLSMRMSKRWGKWTLDDGKGLPTRKVGIRDGEAIYEFDGENYVAREDSEGIATR